MRDLSSGTLDLSRNTQLFRGLDTHELGASGTSNEDSMADFLKYGVGGAAVSAGVGLLNTTYALSESIGILKSGHQKDEYNAINSLISADAASFYDRHKAGIDAAGFVGGSLLPGLASIRVLKFAQTAGKIGAGLEAATGLRNADIVMNSGAVEAAKKYALSTTTATPNWFSAPMIKAYAQGYKQQLMEATAFESGNLIFNNQNASLNPDDLGYFTAIGDQYFDGLKFAAFGGVLGGAVDSLRIAGAVRKFGNDEWTRTQKAGLNTLQLHPDFDNLPVGSKLMDLGAEAERRAELAKTLDPNDWFAKRQFDAGEAQLKSAMLKTFAEGNEAGTEGLRVMESMVAEGGTAQLSSMAEVLSGMQNVSNVSVKELDDLKSFYGKTRTTTSVVTGDTAEDIGFHIADEQQEFFRVAKNLLKDDAELKDIRLAFNARTVESKMTDYAQGNTGMAVTAGKLPLANSEGKLNLRLANMNGETVGLFPDFVSINNESLAGSYQMTKAYNKRLGKSFDMTEDDFRDYVVMHELGHVKNNPEKMLTLIQNTYYDLYKARVDKIALTPELKKTGGMIQDLITASVRSRESAWTTAVGPKFAKMSEKDKVKAIMQKITSAGDRDLDYLGNPAELLADGVSYLTRKATREVASKDFPRLAKMFNEEGAVAKAWNPTKAYYNARTKEVYSSYLPGILDVDPKAKVGMVNLETQLSSNVLKRTFTAKDTAFAPETITKALTEKADYLDYDAHWIMADKMTAKELVSSKGEITLRPDNLATLEKLHTLYAKGDKDIVKAFEEGKVTMGGNQLMPEAIAPLVQQSKEEIRRQLAISKVGYNEHEIAKILNIDLPQAYGDLSAASEGWMLLGAKDYSKPELFAFNYSHRTLGDYQGAVMNMTGVSALNDAVKSQVQSAAAELTGDLYNNLIDIPQELIATVNPFNSRAGLINNTRAEMRGLRERATYIGKQVADHLGALVQKVDSSYVKHSSIFNKSDNMALRFELANVDNLLKREQYYLAHTDEGSYIIRKDQVGDAFDSISQETGQKIKFSPEMLENMPGDIIKRMDSQDSWAPGAVKISDEVRDFYAQHVKTNLGLVDRKGSLAQVKGKQVTLDGNVLYSPPRDLRQAKYFAFVVPKVFKEGEDARRFMVFGESEAEYEAKKLAITQKYGTDYRILTKQDATEYAALKSEYSEGNVFDEINFDSTLMNRGRASELAPNVDINSSATLDRYRVWTIRQEEALARAGVELKYNGISQQLQRMDKHYGNAEASTLDKKYQEPATIWKDTMGTILNKRERGSNIESQFVRVNDFLGDKGSQFVEKILGGFKTGKSGTIDQAQLDAMNKSLADAGYKSPFDSVAEVILSSPDSLQSRAFPAAVRTMSNLVSTLMLRLDPANSMLQLISTPILALPVLQEAKLALRGTEAGEKLKNLTTVLNPETGMAEPTSMKLLSKAVASYFSDDGKVFLQQLRDKNIVKDHLREYLTATDMAQLNGRHTMAAVNDKIDQLAKFGSKISRHDWAEDFSRYVVAHSVKQLAEIRGTGPDEMWALINGSVDKVHGVYAGAQRPQLFQGVLGQSVGLFQTYFFNFAQNMMKYTADANKVQAATLLGMQSSLFGVQSLPGFQALNYQIGVSNKGNEDLYSITNADDPKSKAAYAMYGLASTMFGQNVDFATRGSLAARNMLVIPTQLQDLPIVGTLAKAVGNMIKTAGLASDPNVPTARAMLHGLAHNGMNRPVAGLATIVMGDVTSNQGQITWQNSNKVNYDMNAEVAWGAMFARAIGTRPLNETIVQNSYFRQAAYKANNKREQSELGAKIQLDLADGSIGPMGIEEFAQEYEAAGGEVQSFNAYFSRQLKNSGSGTMQKFQQEMTKEGNSKLSRSSTRMELKQSKLAPWDTDY